MAFLSFYLLKGFTVEYLLNLDSTVKLLMLATMDLEIDRINKGGING
nr:MAG TPA: hypothetical protein [Caudoviricetes sp.]